MSIWALLSKRAVMLFASLGPAAATAQEKPALRFTPAGPWAMEYADEGCRLIRNFSAVTRN